MFRAIVVIVSIILILTGQIVPGLLIYLFSLLLKKDSKEEKEET